MLYFAERVREAPGRNGEFMAVSLEFAVGGAVVESAVNPRPSGGVYRVAGRADECGGIVLCQCVEQGVVGVANCSANVFVGGNMLR